MKRSWPKIALLTVPFLIPFLLGLSVHRQGFNLLDDGLWLLGTRILVQGGTLYGDVFSIYGPARYLLLAPFFLLLGKSALTLAIFKALLDGAAAQFGFWYTRRLGAGRWSWLVPWGVVAFGPVMPRYLAAALFAALVGQALIRPSTRRRAVVLGLAWGGLCLFGLDMAVYGAVILLGGWFSHRLIGGDRQPPVLSVAGLAAGLGAVLAAAVLVCMARGVCDQAFWDTIVYPLTRFRSSMGVSWYESLLQGSPLAVPFGGHATGEVLAGAWPGHVWQRVLGLRAMFVLVWLIPPGFALVMHRSGERRLGPLLALVLAGWVTLLSRGDITHLRLVWFGSLLAVTVMLPRLPVGRIARGVLAGFFLLILVGPQLGEQIWLAIHLERPGLSRWERDSAGIYLETEQVAVLEKLCAELPWDGKSPVLVWPAIPGLQFVLGAPPATAQTTLLGGEVRDTGRVIADLEKSDPALLVVGSARGILSGVTNIQGLAPTLWSYLRRRYEVDAQYTHPGRSFLVARRNQAAAGQVPEVAARLPGAGQEITTGVMPVLGAGVTVAQSFRVLDFDLGAVELLFRSPGPYPYPVALVLTFYELGAAGSKRQLQQFSIKVQLETRTKKVRFSFEPLAGTAGKRLLMEIAAQPAGSRPFSLLGNKATPEFPLFVDYYPAGQVFLNQRGIQADLFFLTY